MNAAAFRADCDKFRPFVFLSKLPPYTIAPLRYLNNAVMIAKMSIVTNGSVNQRIKQVRQALVLSQVQFSRVISLSSGYLAGVEVEKRKVNERLVKLICSSFNVNEKWLKTGEGEMFNRNPDENFTKLISLFKELDPKYQAYILKEINLLLDIQDRDCKETVRD
jgi:transcriptional regulator with XRE-family HTH domain